MIESGYFNENNNTENHNEGILDCYINCSHGQWKNFADHIKKYMNLSEKDGKERWVSISVRQNETHLFSIHYNNPIITTKLELKKNVEEFNYWIKFANRTVMFDGCIINMEDLTFVDEKITKHKSGKKNYEIYRVNFIYKGLDYCFIFQ